MDVLVIGAGWQGSACVFDLCRSEGVNRVWVADQSLSALEGLQARQGSPQISLHPLDVRDENAVVQLMRQVSVTISAVPYFFNPMLTRCAIAAGCPMVDMGGNTQGVMAQLALTTQAEAAGVTIVPDMGLAPGFANLLAAELIESLDTVEAVSIRVGGLPQQPVPPLNYTLLFSVEGLINEYVGSCEILSQGRRVQVNALTGLETLDFPEPVGPCEAFHTLGGSSTLPWTYAGRVQSLDYKTVRYPGHCEQIRLLAALGFFQTDPYRLRDTLEVSPRTLTAALLQAALTHPSPRDYVVVRVTAQGMRAGKREIHRFDLLDAYDEVHHMTAMMRMTAFPVSIVAQLLGRGVLSQPGVFPPERLLPVGSVRQAMDRRGITAQHDQASVP